MCIHTSLDQRKMPRGFSRFSRKIARMKKNKVQTKRTNIMGDHYLPVFGLAYTRINGDGVNFVLLFILSLLKLLTNCTNSPFSPPLRFGVLQLCCGRMPLRFNPPHLLCSGFHIFFNCATYAAMRASSTEARLSASILTASSTSDHLSDLILSAYTLLNRSVSALLLPTTLALAYSSLTDLLCALTRIATLWALILSLYSTANLSISLSPPPRL